MISKHISVKEATYSSTAARKGIDNTPNDVQLENMKMLAEAIFEPLRDWVGGAIRINSFFRSEALNKAVGGSSNSQHRCINESAAIDLDDDYGHKTNAEMFHWIRTNLVFDQLLWEYGDQKNPAWVHVSIRKSGNRKQLIRVTKEHGYETF